MSCPAVSLLTCLCSDTVSDAVYLVPMLLHASFGSIGERLAFHQRRDQFRDRHSINTFAISPQVFPASLISFNRCSSAGLHGVFVLLFLGAGTGADSSPPMSSACSSNPPGSPRPVDIDDIVDIPVGGTVPGAFRFLDDGEPAGG